MPWPQRPAISQAMDGARPQTTEEAANSSMPIRRTGVAGIGPGRRRDRDRASAIPATATTTA